MAHQTEAECLLATGALYYRRIGLKPASGDFIFAGIKRGALSLYYGDSPIYHFDLEGRWQRAFFDGIHYRKGLDNGVVSIDRVREGENLILHRRNLNETEIADLDERIRMEAVRLRDGIDSGGLTPIHPTVGVQSLDNERLHAMLDRLASWDAAAWAAHGKTYEKTYGPIGFLPPDSHQSIVVQAFRDGEVARSADEFADHLGNVLSLWESRSLQANHLFLGGEILGLPFDRIAGMFDEINARFPIRGTSAPTRRTELPENEPSLGGIDLLIAKASPVGPDPEGWALLRSRGLRRVNLILGNDDFRDLISAIKAASCSVAILVPVGRITEREAAQRIGGLPLDASDLIYLIDEREIDPSRDRVESGEVPGSMKSIQAALESIRREKKVKVVPYSSEKQWN